MLCCAALCKWLQGPMECQQLHEQLFFKVAVCLLYEPCRVVIRKMNMDLSSAFGLAGRVFDTRMASECPGLTNRVVQEQFAGSGEAS